MKVVKGKMRNISNTYASRDFLTLMLLEIFPRSLELHSCVIDVPWDSDAKYEGVYEFGGLQPGMSRWVVCAASPKR
jgi:hypothetical protein